MSSWKDNEKNEENRTKKISKNNQSYSSNKNTRKIRVNEITSKKKVNYLKNKKLSSYKKIPSVNTSESNLSQFTYSSNPEIDNEILKLYKQYTETKNSRQKTQMDYNLIHNKLALLQNEEEKIKRQEDLIIKTQEKKQKIMCANLQEKDLVLNSKIEMKKKLFAQKEKNNEIKKERDSKLKTWRSTQACHINSEIAKIKKERKNEYQKYKKMKEEENERKREKVQNMHKKRALSAEIKKQEEYEKKMQVKKALLKKILEEEQKKKIYEKETNKVHLETVNLIDKIKEITNTITGDKSFEKSFGQE